MRFIRQADRSKRKESMEGEEGGGGGRKEGGRDGRGGRGRGGKKGIRWVGGEGGGGRMRGKEGRKEKREEWRKRREGREGGEEKKWCNQVLQTSVGIAVWYGRDHGARDGLLDANTTFTALENDNASTRRIADDDAVGAWRDLGGEGGRGGGRGKKWEVALRRELRAKACGERRIRPLGLDGKRGALAALAR